MITKRKTFSKAFKEEAVRLLVPEGLNFDQSNEVVKL